MTIPEYSLLTADGAIRILTIEPAASFGDPIVCALQHAHLVDHPPYEALSYTWGDPHDTASIQLGQSTVKITKNLEAALRHLRRRDAPRNVWADALCINQANNAEKSIQVQRMTSIYRHCTRVIFWLGSDGDILRDGKAAMDYFVAITGTNAPEGHTVVYHSSTFTEEQEDERSAMESHLVSLFSMPSAWKRAWIVQELALSPEIVLAAGDETMEWKAVEDFLEFDRSVEMFGLPDAFHQPFGHGWGLSGFIMVTLTWPMIVCHQRRLEATPAAKEKVRLLDILARFRSTEATDPRDCIYALLGILPDAGNITVDYALPASRVYTDVMIMLIEGCGNLDPLVQSMWQFAGNGNRIDDLPSWVIDFAHPGESQLIFAQRSIYDAGGPSLSLPLAVADGATLKLSGFKLDTISTIRTYGDKITDKDVPGGWRRGAHWLPWMPDNLIQACMRRTGNNTLAELLKGEQGFLPIDDSELEAQLDRYSRTMELDIGSRPLKRLSSVHHAHMLSLNMDFVAIPLDGQEPERFQCSSAGTVFEPYNFDFGVTTSGIYCRTPHGTRPGDCVVVLRGAKIPVLLRPLQPAGPVLRDGLDPTFEFVGACYVHEFMDGQALHPESKFHEQMFLLK